MTLNSQLYRWESGKFAVVQEFPTTGGTDVALLPGVQHRDPGASREPMTRRHRYHAGLGMHDLAVESGQVVGQPDEGDPNPFGYGMVKGASALHATASMDCLMQVSGESVFVLEDTEIRLQPGDWLIVNGVPHSCRNDLDEPAVLVGVVIGARHDGIPLRTH